MGQSTGLEPPVSTPLKFPYGSSGSSTISEIEARQRSFDAGDCLDSFEVDKFRQGPMEVSPSELKSSRMDCQFIALHQFRKQKRGLRIPKINQRSDGSDAHIEGVGCRSDLGQFCRSATAARGRNSFYCQHSQPLIARVSGETDEDVHRPGGTQSQECMCGETTHVSICIRERRA